MSLDRLRELVTLNRFIASTLEYDDLLERVVEKTASFTLADACLLLLADRDGLARIAAQRGLDAVKASDFAAPLDERISGELMRLLHCGHDDCFLGVPVIDHGSIRGLLAVYRRGPLQPDDDELFLVTALADQAAIALGHASRFGELWQERERHLRLLERENRRKDEFLAMLGHELRNPVAAIASAAEVMRMAPAEAPVEAEIRDVVYRQVRHLARLLDDLLDVSRITRGTVGLRKARLDLRDVVTLALHGARQQARARGQRLEVHLPDRPVPYHGDLDRLVQALSNLLTNAARYTPDGGRIEVAIEPGDDGIALAVRDTGEGISREDLPFLFEPFLQSKRGLDRPGGGLGLGLTLVKQLVELHDGRIEARSEGPGRGSEFRIWLPPVAADPPGAAPQGGCVSAAPQPGRRVLIVEDNADFAGSLATLLERDGHRVEVVSDGRQALERVAVDGPEVVLLDIGLPGMDGFELARRIRDRERPGPLIVAISGYGHEDDQRRASEAGIDHYLVKPFWHDRLRALLAPGPDT
jgi:signal transduction histidine kinase/CheY-like chemotaxis protein